MLQCASPPLSHLEPDNLLEQGALSGFTQDRETLLVWFSRREGGENRVTGKMIWPIAVAFSFFASQEGRHILEEMKLWEAKCLKLEAWVSREFAVSRSERFLTEVARYC